MSANTYITLAIHSYDYAVSLRDRLEAEGISVQLENVNIQNPEMACGVRVRIPTMQLPKALHLVEAPGAIGRELGRIEGTKKKILLPTDFSDHSFQAAKVAFALASMLHLEVVLMHVYATPYFDGSLSFSDKFTVELRDNDARRTMQVAAETSMKHFCRKLLQAVKAREIPSVQIDSIIREGVPEEVILAYTRQSPPEMVIMSTRDTGKKALELIGSVSAEVLDSSRVPVLVLPEHFLFSSLGALDKIVFFCTMTQSDLLAMDMLAAFFPEAKLNVTLMPVIEKKKSSVEAKLANMTDYFSQTYPAFNFGYNIPDKGGAVQSEIEAYIAGNDVKMLIVPNKKRNIFARLFNPGLAHKILFEGNIPLLSLPI